MEKFKQASVVIAMVAVALYMLVATIGKAVETIDFIDANISQIKDDGVLCYTYRNSVSCYPDASAVADPS